MSAPWYAVQVRPAAERRVAEALKEYGVRTFVPIERIFRRVRGRKVKHELPLVRGYVFASIPPGLHPMLHDIDGANGLVSRNGAPAQINPWQLLGLWVMEEAGEFDKTKKPEQKPYLPGDRVRFMSGPYEGRIGAISRMSGQRRIQVVLAMARSNWSVNASMEEVEPVAGVPLPAGKTTHPKAA